MEGEIRAHFYMVQQNQLHTIDTFNKEKQNSSPVSLEEWQSRILTAFDRGQRESFTSLWEFFIPPSLRTEDCNSLYFLSQVYFTCKPYVQNNDPEWNSQVSKFKHFLHTKGADLCQTNDFLMFFALPYTKSPDQHPRFKNYFTENWAHSLRLKIRDYLATLSFPVQSQSLNEDENENENYLKEALIESNSKWTNFGLTLLTMNQNLIGHIQGHSEVNLTEITSKMQEYERFLMTSDDSVSNASSFIPTKESQSTINYQSLKQDLFHSPEDKLVSAILQSLRWRITKNGSFMRKMILKEFIDSDIFNVSKNGLSLFIAEKKENVREYMIKLANVAANEREGRNYLLKDNNLIKEIVKLVKSEKDDTISRQNSVGILQKLSLKKEAQTLMIDLKVVEWLISVLTHHRYLSEYSLEYSSALLMNLSLRTAGKQVCERLQVLPLLGSLIEHENTNVRTYMNGVLYSLFSVKSIQRTARNLGFQKLLQRLFLLYDENFQKQIQCVQEQLAFNIQEDMHSEIEEEEESLVNDDSEFVSEDESQMVDYSGFVGEDLLKNYTID